MSSDKPITPRPGSDVIIKPKDGKYHVGLEILGHWCVFGILDDADEAMNYAEGLDLGMVINSVMARGENTAKRALKYCEGYEGLEKLL